MGAAPGLGHRAPAFWQGAAAPIAAITVFGLAISMSYPLLSLLLERMGASGAAIGLNTMAAAIAIVVFSPLLPRLMARVGLARLMIVSGIGLGLVMLAYGLIPDYWAWLALRLVYGFFGTALFFSSEYWIVAMAPDGQRGRIVAFYTISLSLAFMAGPLVIGATGVEGFLPFAVASAVLFAGVLPVWWGRRAMPVQSPEAPPSPWTTLRFFVTDPALTWAVVLFGLIEFGTVALLPVWAVRTGFAEHEATWMMAAFAAGSVLSALPMGWASERLDRRFMLLAVGLASVAAPLGIVAASGSLAGSVAISALWGSLAVGLYTLPLVELGSRYAGHRLAEGNGAVVLGYGLGALLSPALLGAAMDLVPPDGLLLGSALAAAAYATLAAIRLGRRPRKA
ncbi:MFS transporter [Paralimibaculum aggregatum]|uniref:MFS transporter n=1 Tax=Paralimibaculum aggregatum TaxID=3036245 RepID=A0ABQ6LRN6_9RHOB|nr:MFS transporter [Limibaculum sp. NKW23]GMG83890.1 MFS transporter [Limibaculum sp. NKW23]